MDHINVYPTLAPESNVSQRQTSNNTYGEYKGKRIVNMEDILPLPMGFGFQRGEPVKLKETEISY